MRHITPARLDELEPLLERLRTVDSLVEKRRGTFYRGSKAFLHFHEHGDDFFADIKLDGVTFERMRVTTRAEQAKLFAAARRAVEAR